MRGSNIIERLYATRMPAPFLSMLIDDCIAHGRDYNAGGARYNTTYLMPVGARNGHRQPLSAAAARLRAAESTTMADVAGCAGARLRGQRAAAPAPVDTDAPLRERRRARRRTAASRLRPALRQRGRPPHHQGRSLSPELPVDHLSRVFRVDHGRVARRPPRRPARLRRHLPCPGHGPLRSHRRASIRREDRPREARAARC